ncbi:MAG: outer membrane protein assembly factor BamA [Gammaproteobacteria bacterium]|nr:outer membrane protein assembly factor BamA [Gammaproteobacteria bacterium]
MNFRIFLFLLLLPCSTFASSFVVQDIILSGNKKISDGTVFNYLDLAVGDTLNEKNSIAIIKDLYKTGFFNTIEINREGNTAIFVFSERPSIGKIKIEGNKVLADDMLDEALAGLGISKGKLFNRSTLDKIEQELKQLYYSMGKYSVKIDTTLNDMSEGIIEIRLDISEGLPAKVRDINITGNTVYSDDELLEKFTTTIPSQSFFGSADDYSKAKVSGDLQGIRSTYLNNGYLNFDVDSSQVTISPDRKDINIAVNVIEGEQFSISKIELTGEFVVAKEDLLPLVTFNEGDIFSRQEVTQVVKRLTQRLGESGYAFANVNAIPKLNNEEKTVALNFVIDPGKKMNVRFISFSGNDKTKGHVLRREMRQLESAPFSASKVDRSKIRLQRLKYISGVVIRFKRVKSEPDQMDIVVDITERFSGNFSIGLGFSQSQGTVITLGLVHDNVFGTGKSIGLDINHSDGTKKYSVSYTNPYYTEAGISRGFSLSLAETDAAELDITSYLLDQTSFAVNYGFPLSEYNTLSVNFGVQNDSLTFSTSTADEVFDFVVANNSQYDSTTDTSTINSEEYNTAFVSTSFSYDTRNRLIYPDSGYLHSTTVELFTGDLDFYKFHYKGQYVTSVTDDVTFAFNTRYSQGGGVGDTSDLPFYEKFYAGGVRSVRGYTYNSLGPTDSQNLAFGGNYKVVFNSEFLFKVPSFGDPKTFRFGLFMDSGNVFAESADIEGRALKASTGVSASWYSPVGPLIFSYSRQLNADEGDSTKNFQFSIGNAF